jgi:hypothetical protein
MFLELYIANILFFFDSSGAPALLARLDAVEEVAGAGSGARTGTAATEAGFSSSFGAYLARKTQNSASTVGNGGLLAFKAKFN